MSDPEPETRETVVARILTALPHLPLQRLILASTAA